MRLTTSLRPVKRNKTRWLGVINMFARYERLRPNIDDANPEVAELLPTAAQRNVIRRHTTAMSDFKSVTESLQREDATIGESQILFRSLIDTYLNFDFNSYISTEASIVHSRAFEDAIISIQSGSEHEMLSSEEAAVRRLKMPNTDRRDEDDDSNLSFAERILKRQRIQQSNRSAYIDTRFLLPTSNPVERLFSMSKRIFSDKRRRLLPRTLEALLFLKQNRILWNMALVSVVVNNPDYEVEDDPNQSEESETETE